MNALYAYAYTLNYLNNCHTHWTIAESFCNFAMCSRPYNRPSTAVCENYQLAHLQHQYELT